MNRTLWMFPRNKRTAYPFDVSMMLRVLSNVIADEPDKQLSQSAQDGLTQMFRDLGLADGDVLRDIRSGGFRTYESYLRQLGLTFRVQDPTTKRFTLTRLTVSGEKIAAQKNPATELKINLLRTQFPHPYSISGNVGISPEVVVRPVVFVFDMLAHPHMGGYVTNVDVALACVYGRTHQSLADVVDRCLKLRATLSNDLTLNKYEELAKAVDDLARDIYTPRRPGGVKSLKEDGKEIWDIANTLISRMHSNGLLVKTLSSNRRPDNDLYLANRGVYGLVDQVRKEPMKFAKHFKTIEDWQRNFGIGSASADNRRNTIPAKMLLSSPEDKVRDEALRKYRSEGTLFDFAEFVSLMKAQTSLRRVVIEKIVQEVLPEADTDLERQLYQAASTPSEHQNFEKQIVELLKIKFPSATSLHTGQRRNLEGEGGYADVFFRSTDSRCALIDAKASKKPYSLPSSDRRAMIDYVQNSSDLLSDCDEIDLAFFVSAQVTDGAKANLAKVTASAGTRIGLLTIRDLIDHVAQHTPSCRGFIEGLAAGNKGHWP